MLSKRAILLDVPACVLNVIGEREIHFPLTDPFMELRWTAPHSTPPHTDTFINQCNAMQWLRPYSVAGILPDSLYWVICESCESLRKWKENKKFVKWTGNICVSNFTLAQTHTHTRPSSWICASHSTASMRWCLWIQTRLRHTSSPMKLLRNTMRV